MIDSRCFVLAALFLDDEPALKTDAHAKALAQLIQDTIELYIGSELDRQLLAKRASHDTEA